VDLTKQLPVKLGVDKLVVLSRGQSAVVDLTIEPSFETRVQLTAKSASAFRDVVTDLQKQNLALGEARTVPVTISASESALPGEYKVLFSARTDDVTVSQFVTVIVTQ